MNKMQEILIEKVTVNIGVGAPGERLDYAKELLSKMTAKKPIETKAKKRNPVFKLRVGLPIGTKVTLRGPQAITFLNKALTANKFTLKQRNFDATGNFSFGVKEYIDFPGIKYDPKIGMFGFDVCVTLKRRGKRIKDRMIRSAQIGKKHMIKQEEAMEFAKSALKAKIVEE